MFAWSEWFGSVGDINDAVETEENQRNTIFEKVNKVRTRAFEEELTFNREEIFSPL